jgi:predicted transposase YdaD
MENLTSWEERGVEKARRTIALNMLQENFSPEEISYFTQLTIEQIQQLQDKPGIALSTAPAT